MIPCLVEDILCLHNDIGPEAMKKLEIIVVGGVPLKDLVGRQMGEAVVRVLNHWGG